MTNKEGQSTVSGQSNLNFKGEFESSNPSYRTEDNVRGDDNIFPDICFHLQIPFQVDLCSTFANVNPENFDDNTSMEMNSEREMKDNDSDDEIHDSYKDGQSIEDNNDFRYLQTVPPFILLPAQNEEEEITRLQIKDNNLQDAIRKDADIFVSLSGALLSNSYKIIDEIKFSLPSLKNKKNNGHERDKELLSLSDQNNLLIH